jgi:hypothetical protein
MKREKVKDDFFYDKGKETGSWWMDSFFLPWNKIFVLFRVFFLLYWNQLFWYYWKGFTRDRFIHTRLGQQRKLIINTSVCVKKNQLWNIVKTNICNSNYWLDFKTKNLNILEEEKTALFTSVCSQSSKYWHDEDFLSLSWWIYHLQMETILMSLPSPNGKYIFY